MKQSTPKTQIVIHHSVSGNGTNGGTNGVYQGFKNRKDVVATAFVIGKNGEITQLFSTDNWAYHLGITSQILKDNNVKGVTNDMLNQQSIGIEIVNWGGLIKSNGLWYPAMSKGEDTAHYIANTNVAPIKDVVEFKAPDYPYGFHGFFGFEKYNDLQLTSLRKIIYAINIKWSNIPLTYANDLYNVNMWGTYDVINNKWKPVYEALTLKPAIWVHCSYRPDKSDASPQPNLIQLLKTL